MRLDYLDFCVAEKNIAPLVKVAKRFVVIYPQLNGIIFF